MWDDFFWMGLCATCPGFSRGFVPKPQHAKDLPVDCGIFGDRRTEDGCLLLPDDSQRPLKFLLKVPMGQNINICRFKVRWHHWIAHILTATF